MPPDPSSPSRTPVGWLIGFSLRNKLLTGMFVAMFVGWGLSVAPFPWDLGSFPRSPVPVDAIPDIGDNQQIVFTKWGGRSPQDVEDQVSYPLTTSMLGIPGVKTIRSYSMFGFSIVYVIFEEDIEFYWSRSRILEKLGSLPRDTLPDGVHPVLGPDATALGQVFWYTLEGMDANGETTGGWDLHELRTIQDWTVRYALLSVSDVSEVASVGGFVQEYQVDVDPDALQAYGVTLDQVFRAVKTSNIDVGARTIEINKAEYTIRSLGFVKTLEDIENAVIEVSQNVPVTVSHVANVTLGPALRRGVLDKEGAEAVGGVVVARYGSNPLSVIDNVKRRIKEISAGLPSKTLPDGTFSQVRIVPFYDRSRLIAETIGTLNTALTHEILITIIVVVVMVFHLRSSILIASMLPLAVLICFVAMKLGGVDANIVALSGIAIAIGTIVDMGVIVCQNILRHLDCASPNEHRLTVVHRAASEVGGAVLTAVTTTVISFLPVFLLEAAEGKLFRPLAYTKTFALIASVLIALTVIPVAAYVCFGWRIDTRRLRTALACASVMVGLLIAFLTTAWWAGVVVVGVGTYGALARRLPQGAIGPITFMVNGLVTLIGIGLLSRHWVPLGPERGVLSNDVFVAGLVGGLLSLFAVFERLYPRLIRWCLANKLTFLSVPFILVVCGIYVWLGPVLVCGSVERVREGVFSDDSNIDRLRQHGLLERRGNLLRWSDEAMDLSSTAARSHFRELASADAENLLAQWSSSTHLKRLRHTPWTDLESGSNTSLTKEILWTIAQDWNGRGKEFMPPLDEGSFLYMPVTMPHASIGEVHDVLQTQDASVRKIPEVESVVGKLGRAESALDPAPISMIETVINYKSEYLLDAHGSRGFFRFESTETDVFRDAEATPVPSPDGKPYVVRGRFVRDEMGRLIPDAHGSPFRQWRPALDPELNPGRQGWPGIVHAYKESLARNPSHAPTDIWSAIVAAAEVPGTTSAPRLQPIGARLVMLQSGIRAAMGVKIKGPSLVAVEQAAFEIETILREVASIDASTLIADRIIGKPYLEIDIDREAIARYGIKLEEVQNVIEVAVGGRQITTTVEGRERFPVRVRYLRELRDTVESLGRILVQGRDNANMQIPVTLLVRLDQIAKINYVRGPHVIKSEDTFLVGYVLFDKEEAYSEVETVEEARGYLDQALSNGSLSLPDGVSYSFAGSYVNQVRSEKKLAIILPVVLALVFVILYLHFRSTATTLIVFSSVAVAWSGGFIMLWLYGQPWFLDVSVLGVNMRGLFQVHPVHLSVAVWVGFLALFGIASDDGVVIASNLQRNFGRNAYSSRAEIRTCIVECGMQRVRPCLMTTATTILALVPVLTSTGRGSEIMVPMAIPVFGGMVFEVITMLVVPTVYCAVQELKLYIRPMRVLPD